MVLAQDRHNIQTRGTIRRKRYRMAPSTTLYKGAKVMLNAAGLAVPAAATAGNHGCVGVSDDQYVSDATTPTYCFVQEGEHRLPATGLAQANVGEFAYAVDDETITTDAAGAQDSPPVGYIREVIAATDAFVDIFAPLNAERGPHA